MLLWVFFTDAVHCRGTSALVSGHSAYFNDVFKFLTSTVVFESLDEIQFS